MTVATGMAAHGETLHVGIAFLKCRVLPRRPLQVARPSAPGALGEPLCEQLAMCHPTKSLALPIQTTNQHKIGELTMAKASMSITLVSPQNLTVFCYRTSRSFESC